MVKNNERFLCGKRPHFNIMGTSKKENVTCKTCLEILRFNHNGGEYRCGGRFDKSGNERRHANHWNYRKENTWLKKQLNKAVELLQADNKDLASWHIAKEELIKELKK